MHRQKVAEVEKLMQTVRELEEAVLAGGAAANAVRDYQRLVQEMNVFLFSRLFHPPNTSFDISIVNLFVSLKLMPQPYKG